MKKEEVQVAGADRYCQICETGSSLQPLLPTVTLYLDLILNPGVIWLTVPTQISTFTKHNSHPSSNLKFSYLSQFIVVLQNALIVGQAGESTLVHWDFLSFPCLAGEKMHGQEWHAATESDLSSPNVCLILGIGVMPQRHKYICYTFLLFPFHKHFRETLIKLLGIMFHKYTLEYKDLAPQF